MKKVLKVTGIVVVILIGLFLIFILINGIRNYSIVSNIMKENKKFSDSLENYYFERNQEMNMGKIKSPKTEIYCYDEIYVRKSFINEDISSEEWYNSRTGEYIAMDEAGNLMNQEVDEEIKNDYRDILLMGDLKENKMTNAIWQVVLHNIIRPITTENECYVISYNEGTVYVDKDTSFIKQYLAGDVNLYYFIEKDSVGSEDVEKPITEEE